jgi:hypothetical protein
MKTKYHAIPVLVYVPTEHFPLASDAYDHILLPLNQEFPEAAVFFAEDFRDGEVELDPAWAEFSGKISVDCAKAQ